MRQSLCVSTVIHATHQVIPTERLIIVAATVRYVRNCAVSVRCSNVGNWEFWRGGREMASKRDQEDRSSKGWTS